MTNQINTAAEAEQFVRDLIREAGEDLVADGVRECFNCAEVEFDEGRIWIAQPQTGHWLREHEMMSYVKFEMNR